MHFKYILIYFIHALKHLRWLELEYHLWLMVCKTSRYAFKHSNWQLVEQMNRKMIGSNHCKKSVLNLSNDNLIQSNWFHRILCVFKSYQKFAHVLLVNIKVIIVGQLTVAIACTQFSTVNGCEFIQLNCTADRVQSTFNTHVTAFDGVVKQLVSL